MISFLRLDKYTHQNKKQQQKNKQHNKQNKTKTITGDIYKIVIVLAQRILDIYFY